jgi:pimeloyl-ACP methyl ester carboxylesterase
VKTRSSSKIPRPTGRLLFAATLASAVVGGVAFYRHPSETGRQLLRLRLLLAGASEDTVDVRSLPVRYFESLPTTPRPEPETLVLVHGFGDSAETWSLVLPRLRGERRILAPDLAGFGRTPIPPEGMSFSVLTEYLGWFLDAVGAQKIALVGNSLGGAAAIRYAAEHPERVDHLFLLDSAGLHGEATIAAVQPKTREEARRTVRNVSGTDFRHLPRFILDDVVRRAQEPARQQYRDSNEPTDVLRYLPRIEAPTTIVWGKRDGLIPTEHADRMYEAIEWSELIVLPDIGHVPQLQAPRRVADIINRNIKH